MTMPSPYGSTPGGADYGYGETASPSPTPSPGWYPQRPATRAAYTHYRHASTGFNDGPGDRGHPPPPPNFSPRYRSDGSYGTVPGGFSQSQQQQQQPPPPPHQQPHQSPRGYESPSPHRGPGGYESPRHEPVQPDYHRRGESPSARQREEEMRRQHMRRSSAAAGIPPPIRPQTARPVMHKSGGIPRPGSSHKKPTAAAATPVNKRKATEKDAEKWKIPLGYSLKNWDPDETPMLLLGSVFDANSLGKWIYDWTVFHQGPATPIAEMAGELWLLLIQVSGKTKRAEEGVTQVRRKESAELIEDFIASGHRLMDRLKKLLKACEQPMLKANRTKKDKALGKSAGVEFVETLFGRDRELERTEKFMQAARVWEFRFDANCEEILKNPKK